MRIINKASEYLYKKITISFLIISMGVFISFMIFILPAVSEASKANIGVNVSPDQSFFYMADDLYDMAELYGEEGRRYYIINRFTFDIIWPFVYGAFLMSALTLLISKKKKDTILQNMNLLPLLSIMLDFFENMGASLVMYRYPLRTPLIAEITPVFTLLKWISIGASFLLIFFLVFNSLIQKMNTRTKSKSKTFFILCFITFFVAIAGFFMYVQDYYLAESYALDALISDDKVEVIAQGPYTIFKPSIMEDTAFIFYPGAKVEHVAYAPVLRMIAEEGYPVILVEMPFRFAFFGQNKATEAMMLLPEQTNFVVGGHSLGGAIAASYGSKNTDKVKGLLLWASYSNVDLTNSELLVGSIYGDLDGLIPVEQIKETNKFLPTDTLFFRINGGNHAGFGAYGSQSGDLERTITATEQHLEIVNSSLDFLKKIK